MLRKVWPFIAGAILMAVYATQLHERDPSYVPDLKTIIGVIVIAVGISLLVRWFQKYFG